MTLLWIQKFKMFPIAQMFEKDMPLVLCDEQDCPPAPAQIDATTEPNMGGAALVVMLVLQTVSEFEYVQQYIEQFAN